jgi:hypothetical protein
MIPTNSSGTTNGCDNISSNCVIWQGPDISCIDLCNGDSISEVTSKLATKVCDLITNGVTSNPSLTGLDLSCLNISGTTPTTLVPVLQAMVTQICLNVGTGQSVPGTGGGGGGPQLRLNQSSNLPVTNQVTNDLPIMTLPACMQYNDANGNPVTQLRLDLFATLIAQQVCTNLASIATINSTLTSYSSRLNVLEACVLPCSNAVVEAQIVPTCIPESNIGVLTNVSVVVLALETAFCTQRTATGNPSAINAAIGQTTITGTSTSLTKSSVSYGSITGWNNSPTSLAQSTQNAWVVVDDMYTAIQALQKQVPTGCDAVTFGYETTTVLNAEGFITDVVFNFTKSSIPSSYTDSAGFTKITITDGLGASLNTTVSVAALQNSSSGYTFPVSTINTQQNLSILINFSVTDGSDTCTADQSSVVTGIVPCITLQAANISPVTTTAATITFTQYLGTTAVYKIDILNASGIIVSTYTQNNPAGTVSHQFTGLTPGTPYVVNISVTFGGVTNTCLANAIAFATQSAALPCSAGMDVAFILDYTASMGAEIDAIKVGVAGIVNAVNTSSVESTYRMGLVTADEYLLATSPQPTYSTSTDYVALPAAQKITNTGTGANQIITAWEMFQNNNGTSFTAQLNKLNTGVPAAGVPLGAGSQGPDPTDMAIGLVIEGNALLGAFRTTASKNVIVITDNLPSGGDDAFDATDYARIQSLTTTALTNGVKIFVLGAGTSLTYTASVGATPVYPWRELATLTGGAWNVNEDPATISSTIVNGCA